MFDNEQVTLCNPAKTVRKDNQLNKVSKK